MKYSCTIDASGISAPPYETIFAGLQNDVRGIYGEDLYIEADAQDGQFIAIFAAAINDSNNVTITSFNSFSPTKAQGASLSSIVKLNGLKRLVPTNGQVVVSIGGVSGTIINNGIVADSFGNSWVLPPVVTIPPVGTIDVTATAVNAGDIRAAANTITRIMTPVPNWQTVNNAGPATPGNPVEVDATLRRRQSRSTATPAQAIREAIYGSVANVPGVTRLKVYENVTGLDDADGIPGHSISVVAEGGDVIAIATAIAFRKPPGTGTYGDVLETIVDAHGVPDDIRFFELIDVRVSVIAFITTKPGYLSTTADLIKSAVSNFLTVYQDIGDNSDLSRLSPPIELSGTAAVTAPAIVNAGLTQIQLETLARTYELETVAQSREDMTVVAGPYYGVGATAVTITNPTSVVVGQTGYLVLDNGAFHQIVVSSIAGLVVHFVSYGIPAGRVIAAGSLLYIESDIIIAFKEATIAATTDVTVSVL